MSDGPTRKMLEWAPDIPPSWDVVNLKVLAKIFAGGTPDRKNAEYWSDGTVPWLNSGSVNDWAISTPSELIAQAALANGATRWAPKGSVLVALAGQGKTKGMAARLEIDSTLNQSLAAVVPGASLDYRFLQYWLTSNYLNIRGLAGGDLRDGLNLQHIGSIQVPRPPVEEQRAIAAYLDRETAQIDAFIAKNEELIALLTERRVAVMDEAFVRASATAATVPLKRAVDFVTVGIVVTPAKWYLESGIPALRGLNVKPGSISMDDLVFLSDEGHQVNRKSELRAGDVVVVRTGQAGAAAVVPTELDRANAIDLLIVRTGARVAPEFLAHFLNSDSTARLIAHGSVGSIQGHFNVGSLRELPFPLLPKDEQWALVRMLDAQAEKIDRAMLTTQRGVALARERRAALISAAVTGKIDVGVQT